MVYYPVMDFAHQLREAMGTMTQDELAARTGLAQASISRYLRGKATPNLNRLAKLEAALPRLRAVRAQANAA